MYATRRLSDTTRCSPGNAVQYTMHDFHRSPAFPRMFRKDSFLQKSKYHAVPRGLTLNHKFTGRHVQPPHTQLELSIYGSGPIMAPKMLEPLNKIGKGVSKLFSRKKSATTAPQTVDTTLAPRPSSVYTVPTPTFRNQNVRNTRLLCLQKLLGDVEISDFTRAWFKRLNIAVRKHMNEPPFDASHDYEHVVRDVTAYFTNNFVLMYGIVFTAGWAAVFGLLVRYFNGVNCGSAWNWTGFSLSRSNYCGQWRAAQAFSFLSLVFWFATFVLGVLTVHRLNRRATA